MFEAPLTLVVSKFTTQCFGCAPDDPQIRCIPHNPMFRDCADHQRQQSEMTWMNRCN